jgi:DNA-binding CsgD family transcriptional regulator
MSSDFVPLRAPSSLEAWTVGPFLIVSYPIPPADAGGRPLSATEQEIVAAVLQGASNRDIAQARGVSVHTVANQLRSACRKLGVAGRSELAAYAAMHAPGRTDG